MDIEADKLLSTIPKIWPELKMQGAVMNPLSPWKMQDFPGAALECNTDWLCVVGLAGRAARSFKIGEGQRQRQEISS